MGCFFNFEKAVEIFLKKLTGNSWIFISPPSKERLSQPVFSHQLQIFLAHRVSWWATIGIRNTVRYFDKHSSNHVPQASPNHTWASWNETVLKIDDAYGKRKNMRRAVGGLDIKIPFVGTVASSQRQLEFLDGCHLSYKHKYPFRAT